MQTLNPEVRMATSKYIFNRVIQTSEAPDSILPKASVAFVDDRALIQGYQQYELSRTALKAFDAYTQRKCELLGPYFVPELMKGATVLDLGASGGFYSFWAALAGASKVTSIDIDARPVDIVNQAAARLGFNNIVAREIAIDEIKETADVVIALAILHWMFVSDSTLVQLDKCVEHLARLTNQLLIVEWIAPSDESVRKQDMSGRGPYSQEDFEEALSRHFYRFYRSENIKSTRNIYIAIKNKQFNDNFICGLPEVCDPQDLVSCRQLRNASIGRRWSRVYSSGDEIIKQAEGATAYYEGQILGLFSSRYFPAVRRCENKGTYSVCITEKIEGKPLILVSDWLFQERNRLYNFVSGCLKMLLALRENDVCHHDITFDNILVRQDGSPVLLDFGMATAPGLTRDDLEEIPDYRGDHHYMGRVFIELFDKDKLHELSVVGTLLSDLVSPSIETISRILDLVEFMTANESAANLIAGLKQEQQCLSERVAALETENNKVNRILEELVTSKSYGLATMLQALKRRILAMLGVSLLKDK